jgi:hypothetical protein
VVVVWYRIAPRGLLTGESDEDRRWCTADGSISKPWCPNAATRAAKPGGEHEACEVILLVVRTMREGERPALVGKEEMSAALMEI